MAHEHFKSCIDACNDCAPARGKISFTLPSGEQMDGEYQTITGGSSAKHTHLPRVPRGKHRTYAD